MPSPRILQNAHARVYTVRALLLSAIASAIYFNFILRQSVVKYWIIVSSSFIFLHHTIALVRGMKWSDGKLIARRLFGWPLPLLAVIDIALVAIEIGVTSLLQYWHYKSHYGISEGGPGPYFIPQSMTLAISAVFRLETMATSKIRIWRQRFDLLGFCKQVHPSYTPLSTFLTASIVRPLVRGESRRVIFIRAVFLSCIVVGVPAFGIYTIIFAPLQAQLYIRTSMLTGPADSRAMLRHEDAGIYITPLKYLADGFSDAAIADIKVAAWSAGSSTVKQNCSVGRVAWVPGAHPVAHCPMFDETNALTNKTWFGLLYNISIVIPIPPDMDALYIRAGGYFAGSPPPNYLDYLQPIFLVRGARLIALIAWTQRELITHSHWGISTPRITVFTSEVVSLYPDPRPSPYGPLPSDTAAVTFFQFNHGFATKPMQDTVDETPLSGVSTFGGFWTFLNGAFAVLFGANVMYFVFGRRPLSALGAIHIFQRDALVRRWHEDFPAVHTEGGTPGSESAGIVAFIRERVVDLGDDPGHVDEGELNSIEIQTSVEQKNDLQPSSERSQLVDCRQGNNERISVERPSNVDEVPLSEGIVERM
ncbi:hypothetical protein C8R43DRAFT_941043 [Mycena crocata]|nr:hypothetical protein C8R43DRAFT_941043 [Mycena crocata]